MLQKRKAIVAGSFYDANKESLARQIKDCFLHEIGPGKLPDNDGKVERKTKGVVSPHAGFIFSGPIAAYNYLRLSEEEIPQTII
ncbi:MAG: AmmeMemoRadiSam system protein B, partial [Atribacterota bacterium]